MILGRSASELALTRIYILDCLGVATVGVISCLMAVFLPPGVAGLAGLVYILIGVSKTIIGRHGRRMIRTMQLKAAPSPADARLSD